MLAAGIAGIADYDDVAVCIIEPDAAVVALVSSDGVTRFDRIARPLDGADVVELPSSVMAMLELDDWHPDAIFVVGSADDLDLITTTLEAVHRPRPSSPPPKPISRSPVAPRWQPPAL